LQVRILESDKNNKRSLTSQTFNQNITKINISDGSQNHHLPNADPYPNNRVFFELYNGTKVLLNFQRTL
jgi:hypothetical protein